MPVFIQRRNRKTAGTVDLVCRDQVVNDGIRSVKHFSFYAKFNYNKLQLYGFTNGNSAIMKKPVLFIILLVITIGYLAYPDKEVRLVFLTWDHKDTSHTMTINYLTDSSYQSTYVYYDTQPRDGDKSKYRYHAYGSQRTYPGINYTVHSTRLEDLNPERVYYFVVGDKKSGYSEERKFRTVPEQGPVRFITGGDTGNTKVFKKLARSAAETEPHFAVIGGDIAYANGDIKEQKKWYKFLDNWQRIMVTPTGFIIPLIAVIGNHEINRSKWRPLDKAPFYFMLFKPNGQNTYFSRHLGSGAVMFVLDTDHVHRSHGDQLDWISSEFLKYSTSRFKFANYHVGMYPTFRDPDALEHKTLRRHWLPLFDRHHIDVAFENHEHTLKKTKLLFGNQVSEHTGTYYLGDGSWGQEPRVPKEHDYLEKARSVNHVWSVVLDENTASFKVLTAGGVDEDYSFEIESTSNNR